MAKLSEDTFREIILYYKFPLFKCIMCFFEVNGFVISGHESMASFEWAINICNVLNKGKRKV